MKVTVAGDALTIDFTGSDSRPELQAWSTYGNTRGYTVGQIASMMDPEIPKNEGFFEQIKLVVPEGLRAQPRPGQAGERGHAPPGRRRRRGDRGRDAARAPRARGAADLQDRHPDDHHRRRPAHRRDVHRPLGRGLRRLVQRVEGHGRVGRAQRELRQPLEGDRRDQRVAVPAHPVEPRLPHRLRRAGPVARHLRQSLREGSARRRRRSTRTSSA